MTQHTIVIAGGGPTGLMLAAELALAGVDVAVVERRNADEVAGGVRAGGLHARTLEVLDQRGLVERFVDLGERHPVVGFHHVALEMRDLPTRHNYVLALWQTHVERVLAERVRELAVTTYRGREVLDVTQDDDGVTVRVSRGEPLRAAYVVGCDGGRSRVRAAAAIEFAGWDPTASWLIAEVAHRETPAWGFRHDAVGTHAIGRIDDGRARIVLTEPQLRLDREPTLDDVREALVSIYGTDFGVHDPTWISRFTDVTRQAVTYRRGRVLLAGDAAHVHPPMGGQGLNLGVQDAVNLGWKLAQVVQGVSADTLLDTYHHERHPVAARVLQNTMAQVALRRTDTRTTALAARVADWLALHEPRVHLAAEISGLDVHYALGDGHPLLGRRMPDLDLVTHAGPTRMYPLLHAARPVLLRLRPHVPIRIADRTSRVRLVQATCEGAWTLPVVGDVTPPQAVLVRPDGYVAWVGTSTLDGLDEALATWCGAHAASPAPTGGRHARMNASRSALSTSALTVSMPCEKAG